MSVAAAAAATEAALPVVSVYDRANARYNVFVYAHRQQLAGPAWAFVTRTVACGDFARICFHAGRPLQHVGQVLAEAKSRSVQWHREASSLEISHRFDLQQADKLNGLAPALPNCMGPWELSVLGKAAVKTT